MSDVSDPGDGPVRVPPLWILEVGVITEDVQHRVRVLRRRLPVAPPQREVAEPQVGQCEPVPVLPLTRGGFYAAHELVRPRRRAPRLSPSSGGSSACKRPPVGRPARRRPAQPRPRRPKAARAPPPAGAGMPASAAAPRPRRAASPGTTRPLPRTSPANGSRRSSGLWPIDIPKANSRLAGLSSASICSTASRSTATFRRAHSSPSSAGPAAARVAARARAARRTAASRAIMRPSLPRAARPANRGPHDPFTGWNRYRARYSPVTSSAATVRGGYFSFRG